jgi:hypothetical protein
MAYTDEDRREIARERRASLREANRCINGPFEDRPGLRGVRHGPVVAIGRCQRCLEVKRQSH